MNEHKTEDGRRVGGKKAAQTADPTKAMKPSSALKNGRKTDFKGKKKGK